MDILSIYNYYCSYRDSKDVDLSQAITGIRCPNVECVNDDGTFLLRCDYDVHDQLVGKGSCNGFVAVQCGQYIMHVINIVLRMQTCMQLCMVSDVVPICLKQLYIMQKV